MCGDKIKKIRTFFRCSDNPDLAEEVGFEPTRRVNGLRDFESRLFDHLSTSPYYLIVGILIENCRLFACVAVDQNP